MFSDHPLHFLQTEMLDDIYDEGNPEFLCEESTHDDSQGKVVHCCKISSLLYVFRSSPPLSSNRDA